MKLRCIAVDDEPLALSLVGSFIEQTPFLELVAKFDNAIDALKAIHSNENLDLIFLDIQMSDLTGVELARVLAGSSSHHKPLIIFTTAFDQFALEGYKVDAIDYLLKPFNYEEFLRAAGKAKKMFEKQTSSQPAASPAADHIFLKVEYQLVKVMYSEIRYIEGLKDYIKVHLTEQKHPVLSLSSLKIMEEKLPEEQFMRIHRSFIVNLNRIDAITKNTVQVGNETITISENFRETFHTKMQTGLS